MIMCITVVTFMNKVEGGNILFCFVYVSVCNQDRNSKSYQWIFMKFTVNGHHWTISLEIDFESSQLNAYLFQGPAQNNEYLVF